MFERCLYFNGNALVRRLNRIWDDAYSAVGLSAAHAYLLRMVNNQPGLSQNNIARQLYLEKSTVTRFVNVLIEKKLLRRVQGQDGRENLLFATPSGKRMGKTLDEIGHSLYSRMQHTIGKNAFNALVVDMRSTLKTIQ